MKYFASDIVKRARKIADLENSDFINWYEEVTTLNDAYEALYQELVDINDPSFIRIIDTVDRHIQLPADFHQLRCVTLIKNGFSTPILRRSFSESYNSLSYDLNIEGVDDISCEKKITAKEKIIINSRKQIAFIVIYAAVLTLCAFLTKSRSDFDYRLILQRDSTCVESLVSIFSKENLVEVDAFEEVLPIEEFNKCYVIGGIPTGLPNRNKVSLIIYTSAAICCYIGTILLLAMHYLKKKKLLGKGKQVNKG